MGRSEGVGCFALDDVGVGAVHLVLGAFAEFITEICDRGAGRLNYDANRERHTGETHKLQSNYPHY